MATKKPKRGDRQFLIPQTTADMEADMRGAIEDFDPDNLKAMGAKYISPWINEPLDRAAREEARREREQRAIRAKAEYDSFVQADNAKDGISL